MGKKTALREILELAAKFAGRRPEGWDHAAWEQLLEEVEGVGVKLDEAGRDQLGRVLEESRLLARHVSAGTLKGEKSEKKQRKWDKEKKKQNKMSNLLEDEDEGAPRED